MKHLISLTATVLLGIGAIAFSERRKVDVSAGPDAILYLVADTEQELTRMPVRFTRMSDAEEVELGNSIAAGYSLQREQEKVASVQTVQRYLTQVGSRLSAHAKRKLPYKFHYIADKYFVNAFALPGGHIYVGQGLLALMDSEDELASVMGHEIEHVDHYHCAERAQLEGALRKIPLGGLASLPLGVFEAGYSKNQELEADSDGTRMAVAAGYSANGAIRMFEAFQRAEESARRKARNPGEEMNDVAQQTLEGYFRSHPLPSARIALVQKMIASDAWSVRAERDLEVAYIFWSARAEDLFAEHKYAEAQAAAMRSLKMQPDRQDALEVLAKAYFSQANFADAAATYRRILQMDSRPQFAKDYAMALAAADKKTAAKEFESWSKSVSAEQSGLRATLPGLYLLADNPIPAANLAEQLNREKYNSSPEEFGELGWWYYVAGNYAQALPLLEDAVQQRPGATQWLTDRAWVQIQNKTLEDAFQSLDAEYATGKTASDRRMARAVAFWLSAQKDSAVAEFDSAVSEQPEWKNSPWVGALYSALVADTVQQIQAESGRRLKLRRAQFTTRP
jgi:predicted Zn-dependent protease